MRYTVEVTLADCIAADNFHRWGRPRKKMMAWAFFILAMALMWMTVRYAYLLIPKRIFTTPDEEQALRTILTNALGPAK